MLIQDKAIRTYVHRALKNNGVAQLIVEKIYKQPIPHRTSPTTEDEHHFNLFQKRFSYVGHELTLVGFNIILVKSWCLWRCWRILWQCWRIIAVAYVMACADKENVLSQSLAELRAETVCAQKRLWEEFKAKELLPPWLRHVEFLFRA